MKLISGGNKHIPSEKQQYQAKNNGTCLLVPASEEDEAEGLLELTSSRKQ